MSELHRRIDKLRWWNANRHRPVVLPPPGVERKGVLAPSGYFLGTSTRPCRPSDYYLRDTIQFKEEEHE